MKADDCDGFEDAGSFLQALDNWKAFSGKATYLIVSSRQISRLQGVSDILYIGQTVNLGGNENSRLWNYRNAGKQTINYRIQRYVKILVDNGDAVFLWLCREPPDGKSVKDYESILLSRYRSDHLESPPFNSVG